MKRHKNGASGATLQAEIHFIRKSDHEKTEAKIIV